MLVSLTEQLTFAENDLTEEQNNNATGRRDNFKSKTPGKARGTESRAKVDWFEYS
jgi:hypothetical protein